MAKIKRRQYDDKFRASIVAMLEASGYPERKGALHQIAQHVGVPDMTISRWFKAANNPPPNELVIEKRAELSVRLEELAHKLVDMAYRIADDADTEASIQQVTTSIGIAVDKVQLLKGKPTEIVDDASLTDSERANRITRLLDAARARRDGRAADSEFVQ